jgi:hypothetical protein
MNEELFAELRESVREGGRILRGQSEPSRFFETDRLDIKRIREEQGSGRMTRHTVAEQGKKIAKL